jgi:hypothetical protein
MNGIKGICCRNNIVIIYISTFFACSRFDDERAREPDLNNI